MTTAWVITQEGTRQAAEVIGILSARKSAKEIEERVEWLYALLHCHPSTHLEMARYNRPISPCQAERDKTNTGVPVDDIIRCGDNPYLVATLAENVTLIDDEGESVVWRWTLRDRKICDDERHIIGKIPGASRQAPIHLPLLRPIATDEKQQTAEKPMPKSLAVERFDPGGASMSLEQLVLASTAIKKS